MSHTTTIPALTMKSEVSSMPAVRRMEFTSSPPTNGDLARRIGLALAILTAEGDVIRSRDAAVQVLLTGSTDDSVELEN